MPAVETHGFYTENSEGSRFSGYQLASEIRETLAKTESILEDLTIWYAEFQASRVDPLIREAAGRVLEYCTKQLGISWPVSLVWVEEEGPEDRELAKGTEGRFWNSYPSDVKLFGWAQYMGDKIYVVHDRDVWDVMRTIAHELKHIRKNEMEKEAREADAFAYADQVISDIQRNPSLIGY